MSNEKNLIDLFYLFKKIKELIQKKSFAGLSPEENRAYNAGYKQAITDLCRLLYEETEPTKGGDIRSEHD